MTGAAVPAIVLLGTHVLAPFYHVSLHLYSERSNLQVRRALTDLFSGRPVNR